MSDIPTPEEAARQHVRAEAEREVAYEAWRVALDAYDIANRRYQDALAKCVRLGHQKVPLREAVLDALDRIMFGRSGATPKAVAEYVHRPAGHTAAVLAELEAEGLVRRVGRAYELADGGAP